MLECWIGRNLGACQNLVNFIGLRNKEEKFLRNSEEEWGVGMRVKAVEREEEWETLEEGKWWSSCGRWNIWPQWGRYSFDEEKEVVWRDFKMKIDKVFVELVETSYMREELRVGLGWGTIDWSKKMGRINSIFCLGVLLELKKIH